MKHVWCVSNFNLTWVIDQFAHEYFCCSKYSNYGVTDILKTLFNIVEAPLKKIVFDTCLCCMMIFRWTNKQPGIQSFEIDAITTCIKIYDWISPLNKSSGLWFILPQQSMGGNKCGKSGHFTHLSIFTFLKHLMMLLKYNFSGLHF